MPRRSLVALTVLLAGFATGLLGGAIAAKSWETRGLPAPRSRPAALEEAMRAFERGERERLAAALRALPAGDLSPGEDRAERAFLEAALAGDRAALDALAADPLAGAAAARAAWHLVRTASTEAEAASRRAAFARSWPDGWVLRAAGRGGR